MKKVVPIIIAAVVLAGVVVVSRLTGPQGAGPDPDGDVKPDGGNGNEELVIDGLENSIEIVLEAEEFKFDGPWKVKPGGDCSGGKCAHVPENENQTERNPRWKTKDGKPVPWQEEKNYKGVELVHNGVGRIEFDVETEDDYILWMRCRWLHSCADSVGYAVDDGEEVSLSGSTHRIWIWNTKKGDEEEYRRIRLTKGRHALTLYNREDGSEVDQILLTTEDIVPQGVK